MEVVSRKSLQPFNTFGIGVTAKYFAEVRDTEELRALVRDKRFCDGKRLVLGGGSNLLFTEDFDGLVVKNAIRGIRVTSEAGDRVVVRAGGGESWDAFVSWCTDHDYAGLENLSGIPGSVGAAPVQNIGAYGAELKDTFEGLEAVDLASGETERFSARDCAFGYRDSVFKGKDAGRFLITAVSFRLTRLDAAAQAYRFQTEYGELRAALGDRAASGLTLQAVREAVCGIRKAKLPDPAVLGNAGSFFKNPSLPAGVFERLQKHHAGMPGYPEAGGAVKVPAGWLIEKCGWKGRRQGRAGVHETQALVLVNHGGATGKEVLDLAHAIRRDVAGTFGIELTPEVTIV
ncbi:MAG: UDP-N-acetylmuramate dehydrogenase [Candidatus Omnitrophica bacterium]|nr:UDP-N-acetylmuramate dehydrogenase [Candidatus Omnitrophota bacterium]